MPGKLILMGEHAAVYGRPALVAAVGLRARVVAERHDGAGVRLALPDVGLRVGLDWRELSAYARRARTAWEAYADDPTPERFAAVSAASRSELRTSPPEPVQGSARLAPAHLALTALGELAVAAGKRELAPISVEVRSELPVGAGFGSSAAIAVGVLAAVSAAVGEPLDAVGLDRLALEVERRQHGLPSGADHTTVIRGGVLRISRVGGEQGSPRLAVEPIEVAPATLARFAVFNSGTPESGTGEVVAAVRAVRGRDSRAFERLLDRMADNVLSFGRELSGDQPNWSHLAELIYDYQACLERMGVVPSAVRKALGEARTAGAAGKVSGAGGLTDAGAGSLLVLLSGNDADSVPAALACYELYRVALGEPGLRVEVDD